MALPTEVNLPKFDHFQSPGQRALSKMRYQKAREEGRPTTDIEEHYMRMGVPRALWAMFDLMRITVRWLPLDKNTHQWEGDEPFLIRLTYRRQNDQPLHLDIAVDCVPAELPEELWRAHLVALVGYEP